LTDSGNSADNLGVPTYTAFPTLSRKPALRTKTSTFDPTLRDTMENGMETSRAKFTRRRRKWSVTIDFLTDADWLTLEDFVANDAVYGAEIFTFVDDRRATPEILMVRFSIIPSYTDAGFVGSGYVQNCTFELGEV
jgi:hypothetical protein